MKIRATTLFMNKGIKYVKYLGLEFRRHLFGRDAEVNLKPVE